MSEREKNSSDGRSLIPSEEEVRGPLQSEFMKNRKESPDQERYRGKKDSDGDED